MATSSQIIGAASDTDLLARFVALGAAQGLTQQQVEVAYRQAVAAQITVNGEQTSVAQVHDYAVATYQPTPRPGANPAAVTDDHIRAALDTVSAP